MIISIDPDIDKSGVYIRFNDGKEVYQALTIVELVELFKKAKNEDSRVVMECSYLVKKSNFRRHPILAVNEAICRKAGKNEGVSLAISAFMKDIFNEKDLYFIKPFPKSPFKIKGVWTTRGRATFKANFKYDQKQINDDMRDARLIFECYRKLYSKIIR